MTDESSNKKEIEQLRNSEKKFQNCIDRRNELNDLAILGNISFEPSTGRVPRKSIAIDPTQDVLTADKITVTAKVVPVGAVTAMEISLQLATSIPS